MARSNYNKLQRMESFKHLINFLLVMGCIVLEVALFGIHWLKYFQWEVASSLFTPHGVFWFRGHALEIAIYAAILIAFSNMYGGMRLGYLKNAELIFSQIFATLIADLLIYAELSVMALRLFNIRHMLSLFGEQFVVAFVYILIINKVYMNIFPPRKLLLIYGDRNPEELVAKFETRKDKYIITDRISVREGEEVLEERIRSTYDSGQCNAVIIGDMTVRERKPLIKFCYSEGIRFYLLPKITDVILMGAEELHVFDSPILLTREYSLTMEQRFTKRAIDIIFALILIVLSSPFMLLTALAVKLYDGGPILYKQVRCTRDRKEFKILKFRSMRVDAEKDGVARLASKGDSRITPVGKFIRKCRLDELPQLFNILKGEMSFIGPRPERPEIIAQYMEVMPEFEYRMKVKAGLAGFAQVYGKYNTTPYDKLKLDLTYIENYSVLLDLKLMLLTLKVLLWPDSTEGVEADQITALKKAVEERKEEGDD